MINMKFLSFGERCITPIISFFQIVLRGKQLKMKFLWGSNMKIVI